MVLYSFQIFNKKNKNTRISFRIWRKRFYQVTVNHKWLRVEVHLRDPSVISITITGFEPSGAKCMLYTTP